MRKIIRIFEDRILHIGDDIVLSEKNSHYVYNVMRKKIGDKIKIFSTHGEWIAEIISELSAKIIDEISISIDKMKNSDSVIDALNINCIICPIKAPRLQILIEKITEIGVNEIVFTRSKNTVFGDINFHKIYCWIEEALKQSEQNIFPKLMQYNNTEMQLFNSDQKTLYKMPNLLKFLYTLESESSVLIVMEKGYDNLMSVTQKICDKFFTKNALEGRVEKLNIYVVCGPEGGFSTDEKNEIANISNVYFATLGNTNLRSETAVILSLGIIKNFFYYHSIDFTRKIYEK